MRDMGQYGADKDYTLEEVAALFNYDVKTWKTHIRNGLVPAPMGIGNNQFYTGQDIQCIRHMIGRWKPHVEAENTKGKGKSPEQEEDG